MRTAVRHHGLTALMAAAVAVGFFAAPTPARAVFRYLSGDVLQGVLELVESIHRLVQGFL